MIIDYGDRGCQTNKITFIFLDCAFPVGFESDVAMQGEMLRQKSAFSVP